MKNNFEISRIFGYYHYNFEKGYEFSGHSHECWEINLLLGGSMSITVGSSVYTAVRGDFIVVSPWVFHRNFLIGDKAEMIVVQFCSDCRSRLIASRLDSAELTAAELAVREFDRAVPPERYGRVPDDRGLGNARKLCEVLLALTSDERGGINASSSRYAGIYADAVRVMEEEICRKLTIDELAKRIHVCPSVIKCAFAEIAGKGAMEYFNGLKIKEAKRLLESGKSIPYVSDLLGFSSQCYFSTVFRRVMGKSPKDFRK